MDSGYLGMFGGATSLAMVLAHRALRPRLRGVKTAELLGENRATTISEAGYLLALLLVAAGVTKNAVHGESVAEDATWCAVFAAAAFVLLEVTGLVGTKLLLGRRLADALSAGNAAAGVAAGCHYVATGLLTARAIAGSDLRGLGLSLTFFGMAQAAHQLEVGLFRALTSYDDAEQIEGENLAAAISWGGLSIAIAVVIGRALEGDFEGWSVALRGFAGVAVAGLLLAPIRQFVVQGLVLGARPSLRGGALDLAIGRDRNVGAAALEAVTYVGSALAIAALV